MEGLPYLLCTAPCIRGGRFDITVGRADTTVRGSHGCRRPRVDLPTQDDLAVGIDPVQSEAAVSGSLPTDETVARKRYVTTRQIGELLSHVAHRTRCSLGPRSRQRLRILRRLFRREDRLTIREPREGLRLPLPRLRVGRTHRSYDDDIAVSRGAGTWRRSRGSHSSGAGRRVGIGSRSPHEPAPRRRAFGAGRTAAHRGWVLRERCAGSGGQSRRVDGWLKRAKSRHWALTCELPRSRRLDGSSGSTAENLCL